MSDCSLFAALLNKLRTLAQTPSQTARGAGLPGISIAFSGGLDSRFLAHAALEVLPAERIELLHVTGPHIPETESAWAAQWAAGRGLNLTCLPLNPLELPEVARGDELRCYACKKRLFAALLAEARWVLCDGSNASDLGQFRPGLRALQELGIRSPLAESGLEKPVLRELGRATGLERPDQQARPCLLTRLPYGVSPNPALLARIAAMEDTVETTLRRLVPERAEPWDFRVRLTTRDPEAFALHVGHPLQADLERALTEALANFGPCAVQCSERISGYFDANKRPA